MAFSSVGPIIFGGGVSMVTSSLGANDPEVGTRKWEGGREYVFVYNDCNSQIIPGLGTVIQSGASGYSVSVSAVTSADIVVGICRNATLTTGTYGWVVTKGVTSVKMNASSGTVAAGDLLEVGADGDFQKVSNTTGNLAPAIGKALEAIVSSAVGSAYVSCY
jgi:hypothetical protein